MNKILLLDRNYMALAIIGWKKAIKLLVKQKAEPMEDVITTPIKSGSDFVLLPSIVRLVVKIPWRAHKTRLRFSRTKLLIRDNYVCQYCGKKLNKNATIDHVIPKNKGGDTTYLNCVACCGECNNKKADKSLEEVNMRLLKKPRKPTFITLYGNSGNKIPKEWQLYMLGT